MLTHDIFFFTFIFPSGIKYLQLGDVPQSKKYLIMFHFLSMND